MSAVSGEQVQVDLARLDQVIGALAVSTRRSSSRSRCWRGGSPPCTLAERAKLQPNIFKRKRSGPKALSCSQRASRACIARPRRRIAASPRPSPRTRPDSREPQGHRGGGVRTTSRIRRRDGQSGRMTAHSPTRQHAVMTGFALGRDAIAHYLHRRSQKTTLA